MTKTDAAIEFENGMKIIKMIISIIRDPIQREEYRVREIYKLSLKVHYLNESKIKNLHRERTPTSTRHL